VSPDLHACLKGDHREEEKGVTSMAIVLAMKKGIWVRRV
jgi:hypothetical protein